MIIMIVKIIRMTMSTTMMMTQNSLSLKIKLLKLLLLFLLKLVHASVKTDLLIFRCKLGHQAYGKST